MARHRVRFGLAIDFGALAGDLPQRLSVMQPLLERAEAHGFDSVWVGENYRSDAPGTHAPSSVLVLAALAGRTSMRLGTGVTLLTAWHPMRLAYDAAVLDRLSSGRLTLGVGVGGPGLWRRFGVDEASVSVWVDEALDMLRALWRGEDSFHGTLHTATEGIHPLPVQRGGPPILVGGGIGRSARRAAEHGAGYYAATPYRFDLVAEQSRRYREALAARGGDPSAGVVAVNRVTIAARDATEASELGRRYAGALLGHYASLGSVASGAGRDPSDAAALFDHARADLCLVGTPSEIIDQVERYARAGVTDVQARLAPAHLPLEVAETTVELLGRHVLPAFA